MFCGISLLLVGLGYGRLASCIIAILVACDLATKRAWEGFQQLDD